MYTVNFVLRNSPNILAFHYKSYRDALDLYKKGTILLESDFSDPESYRLDITDHYEGKGFVMLADVSGILLSDIEMAYNIEGEKQILAAKAQIRTNATAKADPTLKLMSNGLIQ